MLFVFVCQLPNLDFDIQIFHFHSLLVEISSFESETPILKSSKKGKKQDIKKAKEDKPQPIIYHPFTDILSEINSTYGTNKKGLTIDVMNDSFEILVIIANVSLDIH